MFCPSQSLKGIESQFLKYPPEAELVGYDKRKALPGE